MKLIFAQGNTGTQYKNTRHNVGFIAVDTFAHNFSSTWLIKPKFHAEVAELTIGNEKVLLVKPTTFYNDSGLSAREIIDFYKLDASKDVLVVHDDLALPFGTVRIREKGSDAGNNGIKSLNNHIQPNYHRVRIGILNDLRERMNDSDFVLGNFSKNESEKLVDSIIPHVIEIIEKFCKQNIEITSKNL